MLEFEHIIQINDLNNTALKVITRAQLWQGLLLRARKPEKFNQSLECTAEPIVDNQFTRTIVAGTTAFKDEVSLFENEKIVTNTVEPVDIRAQSIALIEEPEPHSLFVRFYYQREIDNADNQVDVAEHLKSAYVQIDTDAISMIRMLAESELFDQLVN